MGGPSDWVVQGMDMAPSGGSLLCRDIRMVFTGSGVSLQVVALFDRRSRVVKGGPGVLQVEAELPVGGIMPGVVGPGVNGGSCCCCILGRACARSTTWVGVPIVLSTSTACDGVPSWSLLLP